MIKQARISGTVLSCVLWCTAATAEPVTPIASEQEFLEFLGSWELDDGTWVNPLEFLGPDHTKTTDEPQRRALSNTQTYNDDHGNATPTQDPKATPQP